MRTKTQCPPVNKAGLLNVADQNKMSIIH